MEDYGGDSETINLNWTATDDNIDYCWYNYEFANTTVTCSDNTTNIALSEGNHNVTFYVNDTAGNLDINPLTWIYRIFGNSESYNSSTFETESEYFIINVTANASLTSATLVYNGIVHSSTKTGTVFNSEVFDIPSTEGFIPFYWNFTYGSEFISSITHNQTVNATWLGLCNDTIPYTYVNFTFLDEETLLNLNGSFDVSTWEYWLGSGDETNTLLFSNLSENYYYPFCLNAGNRTMKNTRSVQFSATGYPQRKYDASSALTNTTTNTTLYLLSSADGIYSLIQVVDQEGDVLSGVEVTAERQFSGVWTIIGQETTDDAGTVTMWVNPDYEHRFTFISVDCVSDTVTIRPTQTQYTEQLQCGASSDIYVSEIEGLKYSRGPAEGIIQEGVHNFTYYIYSSKDNIVNASFRIVNSSTNVILNHTYDTCTSSGCIMYFLYNVTNGADIKGNYYVDVGKGSFLLEGDARWFEIDIPTEGHAGFTTFIFDIIYVIDAWGDQAGAADFNRLVLVFFFMCLAISTLNYNFNIDTTSPGAFLIVMSGFILIGSLVGGTTGHGLFYFNNLVTNPGLSETMRNVINNYILAFLCILNTLTYYITINRRAQQ